MSQSKRRSGRTETAQAPKPRLEEDARDNGNGLPDYAPAGTRLSVLKTYKIFVGGKFPRTESGRYYLLKSNKGEAIANMCLCSRKDFRDAVVVARNAQSSWASK